MASSSRHRSAVVAGRGLSRRVAERRRATLPIDRVFSALAQPALTCLGSHCLANRSLHASKMIPLHGIILPAFGRSDTGGSALRPRELDAVPPELPLKFAHSVGAVAHVSDLLDPAGNRDAYAGALQALGLSTAGHVALGQFVSPAPASPISPRGGVFESARGHQRFVEPGTATATRLASF